MIMSPDLTTISNGIMGLLASLSDSYHVSSWPDDADTYELVHGAGAVLVLFRKWDFGKPTDTVGSTQLTGARFQISTLNRSLLKERENPGAYTMIREVFSALNGQSIGPFYLHCEHIELVSHQKGRFHYAQLWNLPHVQI